MLQEQVKQVKLIILSFQKDRAAVLFHQTLKITNHRQILALKKEDQ